MSVVSVVSDVHESVSSVLSDFSVSSGVVFYAALAIDQSWSGMLLAPSTGSLYKECSTARRSQFLQKYKFSLKNRLSDVYLFLVL